MCSEERGQKRTEQKRRDERMNRVTSKAINQWKHEITYEALSTNKSIPRRRGEPMTKKTVMNPTRIRFPEIKTA